ncbi:MAG: aldehyde ferredoxin oxidoreductase [Chloroflexota bacterium]
MTANGEKAYTGKILNVNLSSGEITVEHFDDTFYRTYLGGYGIGVRLALDRIPKGADPLGPENMLGFFPGALTGTPLFGQRFQVVCKSPLTGGWGDANCGGDFGPTLKHAGWDGIIVFGQAATPKLIHIDDDRVEILDADEYWGMLAIDCEDALQARYGKKVTGKNCSVALIGPAGEKLSLISGICNERGRLAARSGVGAVMGAKRLKAIVVNASRSIIHQTKETLQLLRAELNDFVKPTADFFRTFGTTGITAMSAHNGDSPVKNWAGVGVIDFPEVEPLKGPVVNEKMEKHYACWHCPLACGAESKEADETAKAKGFAYPRHTHRPEYEAAAAFGTMNLINDLDALIYANHLSNQYGLDVISAGATISFAFECYEKGILTKEDTDGLELRWGNAHAMIELLQKMGRREGIGDVLADGVKRAAERIGRGAEQYAMHIAGQEVPMHDPKLQPEYYTTYKLDPTPARHTQYEGNRRFGLPPAVRDRTKAEGRGAHHKAASEYMHVVNATGACQFIMMAANTAHIPEWLNHLNGWDMTKEELLRIGERIANMRMAFEVREGGNPRRRHVPERLYGGPGAVLSEGPHKDIRLDTETLEVEFLKECDWDLETCKPSRAKLESLGLRDVADMIGV